MAHTTVKTPIESMIDKYAERPCKVPSLIGIWGMRLNDVTPTSSDASSRKTLGKIKSEMIEAAGACRQDVPVCPTCGHCVKHCLGHGVVNYQMA